jgi:hypothetical protein
MALPDVSVDSRASKLEQVINVLQPEETVIKMHTWEVERILLAMLLLLGGILQRLRVIRRVSTLPEQLRLGYRSQNARR